MNAPLAREIPKKGSGLLGFGLNLQEFVIAMIVYNGLPLAPLGIEWLRTGSIQPGNLVIGSSIFAITIGFASKYQIVFTLGTVAGLMMAALAGLPGGTGQPPIRPEAMAGFVLAWITAFHMAERIVRHLRGGEPALLFVNRGDAR